MKNTNGKKKSPKKGANNHKKALLVGVAAVAVVLGGVGVHYGSMAYSQFDGAEAVRIYIPENADDESVADTLKTKLGDDYGSKVYKLWSLRSGEAENAYGSYVIKPGDRAWSVMNRVRTGRQTPIKVSFNNIRTISELSERVSAKMEFDEADFVAAMDSVLPQRGFKKAEYPAAFVPDSYEFYWTESAQNVVTALADERDKYWSDENRAKAKALGLTPVGVATVASIVEEETAKSDERPMVARLYMNRLDKGMKLQADPTVKFAVGDFSLKRITGEHLKVESPYNTYRHEGLPPGPIRVVERATLDAVLSAPKHDYLYMCAKEDFSGYHNFATTYDAHQANARRYQAKLNQLNIK